MSGRWTRTAPAVAVGIGVGALAVWAPLGLAGKRAPEPPTAAVTAPKEQPIEVPPASVVEAPFAEASASECAELRTVTSPPAEIVSPPATLAREELRAMLTAIAAATETGSSFESCADGSSVSPESAGASFSPACSSASVR